MSLFFKFMDFEFIMESFILGQLIFKLIKLGIVFDDVEFGYLDGRVVLSNIFFRLNVGEIVVIVGENGVGKSILVKFLVCLYDLIKGNIFVDDENFKDLNIE